MVHVSQVRTAHIKILTGRKVAQSLIVLIAIFHVRLADHFCRSKIDIFDFVASMSGLYPFSTCTGNGRARIVCHLQEPSTFNLSQA